MKKAIAIVVCLVMLLSIGMSTTVFADETTHTLTINNPTKDHIYEAYQIFSGTLETVSGTDTQVLTNIGINNISLEIKNNCLSDVEEWLGIENVHKEHDKFVARVKLPIDDGLVSKIMSFGNGIKVLEPECLIEKIKDNAEKILKQY